MMWAHRLAIALVGATLVLILFGGLVTNTGAALAVPDWPTTFGSNMFLYPWSQMVGGIFYEHSHRLIGSLVGLLTIAFAVGLWITERRRWLRWLAVVAVLLVSVQGLLGGLRVLLLNPTLALVHGALAQSFFGLTVAFVIFTSRRWAERAASDRTDADVPVRILALVVTGLVYLQIIFGAFLTHFGLRLDGHLAAAFALLVLGPILALRIRRRHPHLPELAWPATWLVGLLALQLVLGLGSYAARFTGLEIPGGSLAVLAFPVVHRLTGSLILATSLALTLRAWHLPAFDRVVFERRVSREALA